jgi:Do/DeqQ family serine protease
MRRALPILLIAALISYAVYRYALRAPGRGPESFTPAPQSRVNPEDIRVLEAVDREFTGIVEKVITSVVSINTRGVRVTRDPMEEFFGIRRPRPRGQIVSSLGSGVIVSQEGHILTNHHVIEGMQEILIHLTDGREIPARLIGSDPVTDIAVLRIDAPNIQPLPIADSDQLRVGQQVFAIGNPFGLEASVTRGIISHKERRVGNDSNVEFIQTDAAVNRGNSGGPLINIRGEVIGINTAIKTEGGGFIGISFAVPSNTARRILEGVIKVGRPLRGYIGVMMQELTPDIAQQLGLPSVRGALVSDVSPNSPAARAGIVAGDVITKLNDRTVDDWRDFRSKLSERRVDETVSLQIIRQRKTLRVDVPIAEIPPNYLMSQPR